MYILFRVIKQNYEILFLRAGHVPPCDHVFSLFNFIFAAELVVCQMLCVLDLVILVFFLSSLAFMIVLFVFVFLKYF